MTDMKDGGPAYPYRRDENRQFPGMTLRDYFAGQALPGLLSDSDTVTAAYRISGETGNVVKVISSLAYEYADAMIAEREKS